MNSLVSLAKKSCSMPEQDSTSSHMAIKRWQPQDQDYVVVELPRQPLGMKCSEESMILLVWMMR
eukprot:12894119-Prorocentrum_lima.AAC.1